ENDENLETFPKVGETNPEDEALSEVEETTQHNDGTEQAQDGNNKNPEESLSTEFIPEILGETVEDTNTTNTDGSDNLNETVETSTPQEEEQLSSNVVNDEKGMNENNRSNYIQNDFNDFYF